MIRIYMADVSPLFSESVINKYIKDLPHHRAEKAARYRNHTDRALCVGAWILLKKALADFPAYDGCENIGYSEYGKPYFIDSDKVFFNLSHSGNVAVCAIAQTSVGVDVQKKREFDAKICKRFFSLSESSYVMSAKDESEKRERFFRIWTLKEAYVKMTGEGIGALCGFDVKPSFPPEYVSESEKLQLSCYEYESGDYKIAVCASGSDDVCSFEIISL